MRRDRSEEFLFIQLGFVWFGSTPPPYFFKHQSTYMQKQTISMPLNNLSDRQLALSLAVIFGAGFNSATALGIADIFYDWLIQKESN
jgi:hypothetical protein